MDPRPRLADWCAVRSRSGEIASSRFGVRISGGLKAHGGIVATGGIVVTTIVVFTRLSTFAGRISSRTVASRLGTFHEELLESLLSALDSAALAAASAAACSSAAFSRLLLGLSSQRPLWLLFLSA